MYLLCQGLIDDQIKTYEYRLQYTFLKKQYLITSTVSITFIKRILLRQSIICDAITTIFDVGGASTGG